MKKIIHLTAIIIFTLAFIFGGLLITDTASAKKKIPVKKMSITVGKQKSIVFKYKKKRISRKKLTCRSKNKKVATVKKGKIKAKKVGKATIIAKYKNRKVKYIVTAKAKKRPSTPSKPEYSSAKVVEAVTKTIQEETKLTFTEGSWGSYSTDWTAAEKANKNTKKPWIHLTPDRKPIGYDPGYFTELVLRSSLKSSDKRYGVFEGMEKPKTLLGVPVNALSGKKTHFNLDTDAVENGVNANGSYNIMVEFTPDQAVCSNANKTKIIQSWITKYQNTRCQILINYQKDYLQMNVITSDTAHSVYLSQYGIYKESYAAVYNDRGMEERISLVSNYYVSAKYCHYGALTSLNPELRIFASNSSTPNLTDLYRNNMSKYGIGGNYDSLDDFYNLRFYKERGIE